MNSYIEELTKLVEGKAELEKFRELYKKEFGKYPDDERLSEYNLSIGFEPDDDEDDSYSY